MGETEGKVSVTVLHESGMEIDSQLTIDSRRVQHCAGVGAEAGSCSASEEVANKACNETDLGTCVASNGMEVSNDSEVRISNEQEKDVFLLENKEFGCSASCETKEVLNDIELQPSVEGNVKDVVTGSESQPCPDTHNGMEVSKYSEVRISNEQEKDVVLLENKEFGCSASCETKEVLNDIELQPSVEGNVKDVVTGSESQPCPDTHMNEVAKADELVASTEPHAKEVLGIKDPGAESRESEAVDEQCMERFAKEPPNDAQVEAKEVMNESKIEPFAENCAVDMLSNGNLELFSGSNEVKEAVNDFVLEQCPENKVKEASNDDMYSEVSNPNQSPKNATSSLTISSQLVDVVGNDNGGCGEITSACSPNSSVDGSPHEAEQNGDDKMESVSTSCVVLEIPKHVKKTGIRKITFKFSKCKEDYDDGQSGTKRMANDEFQEDYYDNQLDAAHPQPLTKNGFQNHKWNEMEDAEMNLSMDAGEFHDMQGPFSSIPNRELKMSKKIIPDNYPTNVKKLLSTRILEGARVKYISVSGRIQIPGIIRDVGYLCGCSACNFSKVVSAYEFELHAGSKTRHPNNHIYLENGRPIYSIIQELRTAPLNTLDEVIKAVAGSSVHEEYFQAWKASLLCGNDLTYVDSSPRKQDVMHYSTCSYPNRPTEGSHYPASWHYPEIGTLNQQPYVEVPVERKRMIKKPKHYSNSSVWEQKKTSEGGTKKRDNDLHKLLFMPNGLPDGTDLAYYSRGKRILGGYKQGNGIVCSCCNSEISPSQFEAHAGWAAKRQPYRHIYISSGVTLHDIALMLASGQSLVTGGSDDMCAVCGGVGELILCNGCPRAFHADCLGLQCLPADGWHCPYCRDKLGPGRKASGDLRPIVVRLTRVVKAPELEPGGCVFCRSQDFSAAKFDDRTVILCDQCEKEYHVGCLREAGMCDLKELPKDKWFCRDNCSKIFSVLQNFITSGPEEIPAPVLAAIRKKHVAVGLNEGSIDEIQWRILSGKSRFPEHLLLLSRAAAIFRECFDPIVAKSGRDLIPVMVYGRNISGQEFSGMYCVVLIVKSVVVSAALLRIFGQEVAELPLVATCREYQGKGYFQALFSCIERFLLSMNVKHLVLPAAEEAEAMWTKKLGFRKTSNEQMLKYTRDLQLTIFKGTSLLEKEVPQLED